MPCLVHPFVLASIHLTSVPFADAEIEADANVATNVVLFPFRIASAATDAAEVVKLPCSVGSNGITQGARVAHAPTVTGPGFDSQNVPHIRAGKGKV